MNGIKRGRGRPRGTGKTGDLKTLREVAKLVRADGTLTPTTAIRHLVGDDNPSAIRRLQVKWRRDKSLLLDETRHMEIEQFEPVRHANAPIDTRGRVNPYNTDHWNKISLAGWNPERGLANGEYVVRRDFRPGFVSPQDAPKYAEQCLKLMSGGLNDLSLRNQPDLTSPEW